MDGLAIEMGTASLLSGKQLVTRGIINYRGNALALLTGGPALETHGNAKHGKSMGEVRSAIQWVDVPAIVAALITQPLFFAEHIVCGPVLLDALADQHFRSTVGSRDQIGIPFVFDFQVLMEIMHQQRASLARDGGHDGKKAVVIGCSCGHCFNSAPGTFSDQTWQKKRGRSTTGASPEAEERTPEAATFSFRRPRRCT